MLPKWHVYSLGYPSAILRSAGIPNLPIELTASRLEQKSKQDNHPFEIAALKDLPKALEHPVAIFLYGDSAKAQNIIVGIEYGEKELLVGIHLKREEDGIQINSVRGLFPKDTYEWVHWISQGKALYLDKEKVQAKIAQRRINLADVSHVDLNSIAKVVNSFENPKLPEDIRFRKWNTPLTDTELEKARSREFKEWFGDWEKNQRLAKLLRSTPLVLTGEEYKGKYELNRDSVKKWAKENLRGEYAINDTGEIIHITAIGVKKSTSHSMGDDAYLKTYSSVPILLNSAIFITEQPARKEKAKFDRYRYYVVGLKIGGEDYTAKITIGVDRHGNRYYDHSLTKFEKNKLIDYLDQPARISFISMGDVPIPSVAHIKDTKLLEILQPARLRGPVDQEGFPTKESLHAYSNDTRFRKSSLLNKGIDEQEMKDLTKSILTDESMRPRCGFP